MLRNVTYIRPVTSLAYLRNKLYMKAHLVISASWSGPNPSRVAVLTFSYNPLSHKLSPTMPRTIPDAFGWNRDGGMSGVPKVDGTVSKPRSLSLAEGPISCNLVHA